MAPPLISDYKLHFIVKRILQTFFGGPVLWIRPFTLILVQILLFVVPVIELIVVRFAVKHGHHWRTEKSIALHVNVVDQNGTEIIEGESEEENENVDGHGHGGIKRLNYFWIAMIVGATVLIADFVLTLFICALKAVGRRGTKKVQPLPPALTMTTSRRASQSQAEDALAAASNRSSIDVIRDHEPDHPVPFTFLAEEDQLEYKGIFHSSTWNFIVPNVCVPLRLSIRCVLRHFTYILATALGFSLCSPLIFDMTLPIVLRGFGLFALCTARYSALFHTPFEIATFDTIRQGKDPTYRIFYVLVLGISYLITHCIVGPMDKTVFLAILACLPFFWSFGVLPPLEALFPWLVETVLQHFGGSTSFFYFGSVLCMCILIGSSVLVLITDEHFTLFIIAQCIFGYMISCDMGVPRYFFKSSSSVCGLEAMPFNKCAHKLLPPFMQILFSILFIYMGLILFAKDHPDDVPIVELEDKWIVETVIMSLLALNILTIKVQQYYLLGIGKLGKFLNSKSSGLLLTQGVLVRILTATLHLLITIELGELDHTGNIRTTQGSVNDLTFDVDTRNSTILTNGTNAMVEYEVFVTNLNMTNTTIMANSTSISWFNSSNLEQNTKSLIQLFMYSMTIRAFALGITRPRETVIDMALAVTLKYGGFGVDQLHFPLLLLLVSFPRKWACRLARGFGLFSRFLYSACSTTLLESKLRVFGLTLLFLPMTVISIMLAAVIDGTTLTPLFTLPIFTLGFPRPGSFWKQRWFPFKFSRSSSSQVVRSSIVHDDNLDYVVYEDVSAAFVRAFVRKVCECGMRLQTGHCFLARFDDRLMFLRVLTISWDSVYLQIKGLEMQEQTSCHHHEAAWVDELLDSTPYLKLPSERDAIEISEVNSASFLTYYLRRLINGRYSRAKGMSILSPLFTLTLPTYTESKSSIEPLTEDHEKDTYKRMFFCAFTFLWIRALCHGKNKASNGHISLICSGVQLFDRRRSSISSYASSTGSGNGHHAPLSRQASAEGADPSTSAHLSSTSIISKFPYLPGMEPVAESRTSPGSLEIEPQQATTSFSTSVNARPGTYTKSTNRNFTQSELEWIQYQINDLNDEAEVRRIVKTTWRIWSIVIGDTMMSNDRLSLYHFFEDGFKTSVDQALKNFSNKAIDRVNADIVVKSFRYAVKLTLDHLYSHGHGQETQELVTDLDPEQFYEIAAQIRGFERNSEFCTYKDVAGWIQKKQTRILTMTQPSSELTQLHIFNYHELKSRHRPVFVPVDDGETGPSTATPSSKADGVRIAVGQLSSSVVDGIWSNLNLELLYLTSDDDERYSIQHDKILLRNICTQAASSPLGYFVYDSIFRVNLLDQFKIQQMQ